MPTTYAHYRFGANVIPHLPLEDQIAIQSFRFLFDFGVHGPDLLFYYRPMCRHPVNRLGHESHRRTGRAFFTQALEAVEAARDRDKARAYLYGLLCHFALDRTCHPYIAQKERDGVSHSRIEASFDRFLMERDGINPRTHNVTAHLHPGRESARTIAPFYPPVTEREVLEAERSMVFYLQALIPRGLKGEVLCAASRTVGQGRLADMLVPAEQPPETVDSDLRLDRLYASAVPLAVDLIGEADACLQGAGSLGPGFDHTFGAT